jgi:predicted amidophosphoribosyltransferase
VPGIVDLPAGGSVRAGVAYEGLGAVLIQRFKFDGRSDALDALLDRLTPRLAGEQIDTVVPVPRHPARIRELGREPVRASARALARRTGVRLAGSVLARNRPTRPQTGLDPALRIANVAGSFRAVPGALRGCRVLLLDDVATTGATLRAAELELRRARPRVVVRAALAVTPRLPIPPPHAL